MIGTPKHYHITMELATNIRYCVVMYIESTILWVAVHRQNLMPVINRWAIWRRRLKLASNPGSPFRVLSRSFEVECICIMVFITQSLPHPLMRTPPPPPPFQYTEAGLHSACSCSQARATVESVFSWDRCFSDGASGNLVHRNCDRGGDSCCCSTTR